MGADGDWLIEMYEGERLGWTSVAESKYMDRNYALFGLLNGIRGDDEPLFGVRGLPADRDRMYGRDPIPDYACCPTWFTTEEAEKVLEVYAEKHPDWGPPRDWQAIVAFMKHFHKARVIFWTDQG